MLAHAKIYNPIFTFFYMEPTIITWILVIFGFTTVLPLFYVQLRMVLDPHSRKTTDVILGKGKKWKDESQFKYSLGASWADLTILLPLLVAGSLGVLFGQLWGYVIWFTTGVISFYINVILWFPESESVIESNGKLVYFTYWWGFFIYWGLAVMIYSALRFIGIVI